MQRFVVASRGLFLSRVDDSRRNSKKINFLWSPAHWQTFDRQGAERVRDLIIRSGGSAQIKTVQVT